MYNPDSVKTRSIFATHSETYDRGVNKLISKN